MNASEVGRRNGGAVLSCQASERSLLAMLVARLRALDVDVLMGHNIAGFDLPILLHRLQHHKVGGCGGGGGRGAGGLRYLGRGLERSGVASVHERNCEGMS